MPTMPTTAELIAAYRQRACPRMLRHATTLPFYRQHWGLPGGRTPESLHALPLTTKRDIPRLSAHVMTPELLGAVVVSSGTTGRPVARVYSQSDLERWTIEAAHLGNDHVGALIVDLEENGHGAATPPRRAGHVNLMLPIVEEEALVRAHSVIREWIQDHGSAFPLQALLGAPWSLSTFAAYLRHLGEDPASLGLVQVLSYADRLPGYMRDELTSWYRAPLRDSYSMSELRGVRADRCPKCDRFHLQHTAVPEFLGLESRASIEEGPATLVLTELLPDGADTPLIRYETGDIVWRHRNDCPEGVEAFETLGRMRASPRHPGTDALLVPDRLIGDALAVSGLVAREAVPLWLGSAFAEPILEPLHQWSLDGGSDSMVLQIVAQRARTSVGTAVHAARVIDDLRETWSPLDAAVSSGAIRVEVSFVDAVEYAVRPKWRPRAPHLPPAD